MGLKTLSLLGPGVGARALVGSSLRDLPKVGVEQAVSLAFRSAAKNAGAGGLHESHRVVFGFAGHYQVAVSGRPRLTLSGKMLYAL